jgi:hypothetical protein
MRARSTLLAVLAVSVLLDGAAGAVAAQPENAGEGGDAGPPDDLPEPVPDFVSDVHGAIGDFLGGAVDSLGDAVSGVTPGGDDTPDAAERNEAGSDA